MYFFSQSTGGFYTREIHGDAIPEDAAEISDELYASLMGGQSQGKMIVAGEDGHPILADPPPPTAEQLATAALIKRDRLLRDAATRIAPLQDAVDLGVATEEEDAKLLAWKRYRVALNRIEQQPGYPSDFVWPERPDQAA
ncbi:tail fiber assembly protein [Achromobacter sp. PD1]|uniref:tail fiber assembly protein n=1 Tax=Achromobacter TaxID=222 RepID=UPI0027BAA627|nr:tail fiber assembly protein [Achromobacter aegrifaciens]WLW59810.1 tail fiber assembly protein [Achromobacter aegrifaciens]